MVRAEEEIAAAIEHLNQALFAALVLNPTDSGETATLAVVISVLAWVRGDDSSFGVFIRAVDEMDRKHKAETTVQ